MTHFSIWRCPNCFDLLTEDERVWRCVNNHVFDKAKQGYANLLLANQKNSLEPGDSAEMINARREFLNAGYYQPLADALTHIVDDFLNRNEDKSSACHILDLGCGEGYYLHQIQASRLDHTGSHAKEASSDAMKRGCMIHYHGIDISKVAVKKAAQSQPDSQFAVASSYSIPVIDNSVDLAFCVFAPLSFTEVQRVLKSGAWLVRVYPGPRHLYQLKLALYDQVTLHEIPKENEFFHVIENHHVSFTAAIHNQQDIRNLLAMTPLNWRGNTDAKLQLMDKAVFDVECDFYIQILTSYL